MWFKLCGILNSISRSEHLLDSKVQRFLSQYATKNLICGKESRDKLIKQESNFGVLRRWFHCLSINLLVSEISNGLWLAWKLHRARRGHLVYPSQFVWEGRLKMKITHPQSQKKCCDSYKLNWGLKYLPLDVHLKLNQSSYYTNLN